MPPKPLVWGEWDIQPPAVPNNNVLRVKYTDVCQFGRETGQLLVFLAKVAFRILAGILTHKLPPAFLDVRLSVETLCRTGCAYSSQLGA